MAKPKMKAVRMEGKVVGYVGKDKYGMWRATDAKRKTITNYQFSREIAVRRLVWELYDIDSFIRSKTTEAIARMDKKKLRV